MNDVWLIDSLSESELSSIDGPLRHFGELPNLHSDLNETINAWETARTRSPKRLYITISAIILIAFISGIEFSSLPFLGLSTGSGNVVNFSICLWVVLLISGMLYQINRTIDLEYRNGKIALIRGQIEVYEGAFISMCDICEIDYKNNDDMSPFARICQRLNYNDEDLIQRIRGVSTIRYYLTHIKPTEAKGTKLEALVFYGIHLLAVLATLCLSSFWYEAFFLENHVIQNAGFW